MSATRIKELITMGEIAHRTVRGIRVLDLSGEFTSTEDEAPILSAVAEAISEEPSGIILNYGKVTRMTSGNYGVFLKTVVMAHKRARESGLIVKLLIPDDSEVHHLMEHLRITKLDKLVQVFANETDAVSSFSAS
jgi:hypothetical protein